MKSKSWGHLYSKNKAFLGIDKKPFGIGFHFDIRQPYAGIPILFTLAIDLIWIRFYWIRNKM